MKNLTLILALSATACGKDEFNNNSRSTDTTTVDNQSALALKELPECSEANLNQLIYLKPEKAFYSCDGAEWSVIDMGETEEELDPLKGQTTPDPKKKGLRWILLGVGPCNITCEALNPLTTNPTNEEAVEAIKSGLFKGQGNFGMWTKINTSGDGNPAECRHMGPLSPRDYTSSSGIQGHYLCKVK